MTAIGPDSVLAVFILFCRIGAVIMLMPGFSSNRIPVRVRLFVSLSITLALAPLLSQQVTNLLGDDSSSVAIIRLFASETLVGLLIGFLARILFGAVETFSGAIAMSIGLTSAIAGPMEEHESLPAITTFIIFVAAALVFITNLHWEVIRGIAASYSALPVVRPFDARFGLIQVSDCLTKSFLIALRIGSPFMIYALITNFAIGLACRMVPQIPVYFITVPAVLAGGLALWYLIYLPFFQIFNEAFLAWIAGG
jgi:flagellar biosynthesis protein FliR